MDWDQLGKDFIQRYKDTFVRVAFNSESKYNVMLVEEVAENPLAVTLVNKKLGRIILNYQTDAEFNFEYPEVGYFNFRGMACIFYRLHLRQWKRGICQNTCRIINPYSEFGIVGRWDNNPSTAKLFAAFRPRRTVALSDALLKLDIGDFLSVPLTSKLAVGLSPSEKYKTPLLWYLDQVIGRVSVLKSGKAKIILGESQFKQEVTDFLNKTFEGDRYVIVT